MRFEVIDWENYSTVGVGRPQELITQQTLERFKDSLALVIGIMAQRFGSPTGEAESGTEEEFRWALANHRQHNSPEIKWFFKRIEQFNAPADPEIIADALDQWKKVRAFRNEMKTLPMLFAEYPDTSSFKETFENDLTRWLANPKRPWIANAPQRETPAITGQAVPDSYYKSLEQDFHRLDIAGIDNDRAFEIPLSEIYVKLRVMFDEELQSGSSQVNDAEAIDIQTALLRYSKLVIVGDPGSGKSTFLKYVALMLARSVLQNSPATALEKLCIQEPLPLPVFISCWDLSDFLRERREVQLTVLLDFLAERMTKRGFKIATQNLDTLLTTGNCCLLFDGLDEVPTDRGRSLVSRLLEDCVTQFPENRYVITSRVRAYTGDTILKGEFARCDIQPFDANDRAQFLKNWMALLFESSLDDVLVEGTEANREFQSLIQSIEANDRIRPLAVNPLLLTVIAIVHWNRKRLPEQRVDLYDECVDVLLGQRKEAEHIQGGPTAEAFDEQAELQQKEERPWLRKRFAEIALRILEGEGDNDEVSKSDIVKLLAPRFLDKGAKTQDEAEIRAEIFLAKQELRSGLLVSRREHSYRFVHLTFQEYLAAWHLSNQEFDQVAQIIELRLRQQRWFEPLQLLGGEWAKQSDEKLDRYLKWLIDRQGQSIIARAAVVALCANIVKDISGIAELTTETRKAFRKAVEDTLDAFRPKSGVPVQTQLEILEALGRLGAAVKSHLIDATKSGLNQVRSRAIEMLLPHLSDDELFDMGHLMDDRSKEPIKTYLRCLLGRDSLRTAHWMKQRKRFLEKATEAITEIYNEFDKRLPSNLSGELFRYVFMAGAGYLLRRYSLGFWLKTQKDDPKIWPFAQEAATKARDWNARVQALESLVKGQKEDPQTWRLVREAIMKDPDWDAAVRALELLVEGQKDDSQTWQLIYYSATKGRSWNIRMRALELLVANQKDDSQTWQLVREATKSQTWLVPQRALELLAKNQNDDPRTWQLVREATKERGWFLRRSSLELLVKNQNDDPQTWQLVREATKDRDWAVRRRALDILVENQADDPQTWQLVSQTATKDQDIHTRNYASHLLIKHHKKDG